MTVSTLLWTMVTSLYWTVGSSQTLLNDTSRVLYPRINGTQTLACKWPDDGCETVFWFRGVSGGDRLQFLVRHNNADRTDYGEDVEKGRFKPRKGRASFSLLIESVQEGDAGIYSCVLKYNVKNKKEDVWSSGVLLLPGVTPPTQMSPPKRKRQQPVCHCVKKKHNVQHVCDSVVLWPVVAILVGLAVALLSTLYYFSRLPKKCHHHFAKKRGMKSTKEVHLKLTDDV